MESENFNRWKGTEPLSTPQNHCVNDLDTTMSHPGRQERSQKVPAPLLQEEKHRPPPFCKRILSTFSPRNAWLCLKVIITNFCNCGQVNIYLNIPTLLIKVSFKLSSSIYLIWHQILFWYAHSLHNLLFAWCLSLQLLSVKRNFAT